MRPAEETLNRGDEVVCFQLLLPEQTCWDRPAITKKIHHLVTAHAHHRQTDRRTDGQTSDRRKSDLISRVYYLALG